MTRFDVWRTARRVVPDTPKRILKDILCSALVGAMLAVLARDNITHRGCRLSTRSKQIPPRIKAELFWHLYESAEAHFVLKYLRPELDAIELGGSIGAISCLVRRRLEGSASFVTVEADPALADLLEYNLAVNYPRDRFAVINAAVDYDNGGQFVPFARSQLNLGGRLATTSDAGAASVAVRRTTLSEIVAQHASGSYTLICDIEGAEAGMILTDGGALEHCQQIIVEFHDTTFRGVRIAELDLIDTLEAQGFDLIDRYGPVCMFGRPMRQ